MVAFVGHRTGGINKGEGFPGSSLNEGKLVKHDLQPLDSVTESGPNNNNHNTIRISEKNPHPNNPARGGGGY